MGVFKNSPAIIWAVITWVFRLEGSTEGQERCKDKKQSEPWQIPDPQE